MKDQRVDHFRKLLESLVESLEADIRVGRWEGPEAVPEPLKKCASRLVERLAAANRLASDHFVGSPAVVASLSAMSEAARRLDAAYVESQRSGALSHAGDAAMTLSREIDAVKDGPWR
ncbi:MAG TPA: hypothetical protein VGI39_31920 [Polyangiaceae bacterium]|jgi:hypothetical protein